MSEPDRESRARMLVAIARSSIARAAPPDSAMAWNEEWLRLRAASFATLRLAGELRGCIGTIDARRPLGDDVAHNAFAAAYRDSRFAPVAPGELPRLEIEVSVLSAREPLAVATEDDALASLRPGIDGVYLEYRGLSATFLPQVWEGLPDPRDFLGELRRKAGLPLRFWDAEVRLSRYVVEKYR
jgi:AmmeMemoRadiSam system protein A